MADQPITGLPTKTASGVATTDKMLGIDSAEGYQILVQDVAKYIIENYGGSTLAGAARTPKAAIDLLDSKTTVITLPTTDVTSSNAIYALYDARSNGESFRQRIATPNPSFDGLPTGNCVLEGYKNSANYGWLRLTTYGEPYGTVFSNVKTNGTWSGWKLVPTRDEITALNSNSYLLNGVKQIPNGTNVNTMITPGTYQIQFVTDAETMSNLPLNTAGIFIVEKSGYASSNYFRQTLKQFNSGDVYCRYTMDGGSTWVNWSKEPTRTEVDALKVQSIQGITTSSTGAGDTGISSASYYITNPLVTNRTDTYCETFIVDGHWFIKAISRIDGSAVANASINVRLLKVPV